VFLSPWRERQIQGVLLVCDRCGEIDIQTSRYRELAKSISDNAALAAIDYLIAKLEGEKVTLHPPPMAPASATAP
jgi:hypothetical protein